MINGTLLTMLAALVGLAAAAHFAGGQELLMRGLGGGSRLLLRYGAVVVVSFLAAGIAEVLIPRDWVRGALGEGSGLRGIVIAVGAGAITPSGPFVSMPLAAMMVRSGAAVGPVVAFVSGWALLAVHRLVAWEIPILGWRLALLRYGICLGLPVLAGLLARAIARG